MRRRGKSAGGPASFSLAHGRRDTNAYPPTPHTTGTITNIPNSVLIIDLFSLCPKLFGARSLLCCGGSGDPKLNHYVDSARATVISARG